MDHYNEAKSLYDNYNTLYPDFSREMLADQLKALQDLALLLGK
jgi:hypothetical protein